MKYLMPGIILGMIINFFTFYPGNAFGIFPHHYNKLKSLKGTELNSKNSFNSDRDFFLKDGNNLYGIKSNGKLTGKILINDTLAAFSGNGKAYIKYSKVGNSIEFYNYSGERFWKIRSLEYPYLSYNGKLNFLMNGDHSAVRVVDNNGKEIGIKKIVGRMCTSLSFSKKNDFGTIGFLDGSYYLVNVKGEVIFSDALVPGVIVKGSAVSSHGKYILIHGGNIKGDFIRVVNVVDNDFSDYKLKGVCKTKISLFINSSGDSGFIDGDRFVSLDSDGDLLYKVKIPLKRAGHSSIDFSDGLFFISYTVKNGESLFVVFNKSGSVLFSKRFELESFLHCEVKSDVIFLRGSDNLFLYSYQI